jgi:hypothetical protein
MTDPTPAALEAAARALLMAESSAVGVTPWEELSDAYRGIMRRKASAAIAAYTAAAGDAQWNAAVLAAAQLADDIMRPAPESAWESGQSDCAKSLSNRIRTLLKGPGR